MIRLFHRCSEEAAKEILANGFKDGKGYFNYYDSQPFTGIWLYNVPPAHIPTSKEVLLEVLIDVTAEEAFKHHEIIERDMPSREFLFSSAVLNAKGKVRTLTNAEADAIRATDCWNDYPPGEPDRTFAELEEDL